MKSSLLGPIKATAATIAIVSGLMFTNMVSAEQDQLKSVDTAAVSAGFAIDF